MSTRDERQALRGQLKKRGALSDPAVALALVDELTDVEAERDQQRVRAERAELREDDLKAVRDRLHLEIERAELKAERAERERDENAATIGRMSDDLDEYGERAERAEAELAALRERVRGMADNADRWAEASLSRDINGRTFGATVTTDGLRDLLDDDTTGAASGEGEK